MQRCMVRSTLSVTDGEYEIRRTKESKPYVYTPTFDKHLGNWNYNVSHHGKYVCIASHPKLLVGVDIVDTTTRSRICKNFSEFVVMFNEQLTRDELLSLSKFVTEDQKYRVSFIY